ncbi:MAG TPA: glycoside hydrolase family 3 N-terminal domain-containing protein [Polyangiaceae bacterium]|nr:glycoside hydrolase family 3 N-terminal domain-containing protein [Polyangiaceae bacterium]
MPPRDLNKNGRIDPYEDPGRPTEERVADLLGQMTLEEKAGLMFHDFIPTNGDGTLVEGQTRPGPYPDVYSTRGAIHERNLNHFCVLQFPQPREMCEWVNRVQALAEESRLGIPVTLSSNPIHGYDSNPATGTSNDFLSRWPEPIGFGAIGDDAAVRSFAEMARREYLALGLRVALHPMADLATEPRWARINGTFGEDAALSSRLCRSYVEGFQGHRLGPDSVACCIKHFPGGGPQKDGEDAHFPYGREQVYPGGMFEYHLSAFAGALDAGVAFAMPYYGMPVGLELEEVGFSFNRDVITGLLRERLGYDGIVLTDFKLVEDQVRDGKLFISACSWGVEDLSPRERVKKILEAGCDQVGGEACSELLVDLVRVGEISESRIDESCRRLLRAKFELGLFDDPYLDVEQSISIVGDPSFRAAGREAQRRAIVLLKNDSGTLPLREGAKVYLVNIDRVVAEGYAETVDDPQTADVALIRLSAPFEQRDGSFLESRFHAGDLDFKAPALEEVLTLLSDVPTVVDIYLDRPAVVPEIANAAAALVADFGAEDSTVLDVVFGRADPGGRLPFELPSSMDAVREQKEDVPSDSRDPLFPLGHGLSYAREVPS